MATARVHIFSKCIFRLNDAAHSRGGCSVQGKDIVSKGPPDIQQMPFLLVRAIKDDLESVIYSPGQLLKIEHPDQTQ